jgi:hypothetical protein
MGFATCGKPIAKIETPAASANLTRAILDAVLEHQEPLLHRNEDQEQ